MTTKILTFALRTDGTRTVHSGDGEPSDIETVSYYTTRELLCEEANTIVTMTGKQLQDILKTYIK